ncbi:MAG: helix-turn-helix domain-containing protein [Candidatus Binatia bacterium]
MRQLGLVRAIGDALAGAHPPERIAGIMIDALIRHLEIDRVVVWGMSPTGGRLRALASARAVGDATGIALPTDLLREVAERAEPMHLADRAVFLQPLRVRGCTVGVIGAAARSHDAVPREVADAIALVAPSIARALENMALRTRAAADGDGGREARPDVAMDARRVLDYAVGDAERAFIERALLATRNNRTRAARLLGIARRTLLYKLKRYGITDVAAGG